jgi:hypothetical protein
MYIEEIGHTLAGLLGLLGPPDPDFAIVTRSGGANRRAPGARVLYVKSN